MLTIGVDAHTRIHAAVALDTAGQVVGHWRGPNRPESWAELGAVRQWGIEGAGQYELGLAQYLVAAGEAAWEVNPRQTAAMRRGGRQRGTTDRLDAQAVARVVRQAGAALPRVQPADVTAVLAVLVAEREGALAAATRLRNQLQQLLHQLEPIYQARFPNLTAAATVAALTAYIVAEADPVQQAQAGAVRRLARRLQLVLAHAHELTTEIAQLARVHLQPLVALAGVGWLTAGMLAAYLGPGIRCASDAQLAMYAGVAPLEASRGEQVRYRRTRTGHRRLNALLHRIAWIQAQHDPRPRPTWRRGGPRARPGARRCGR